MSATPTAASRTRRGTLPLVGVLAVALFAELIANRVGARLAKTDLLLLPHRWLVRIDTAGLLAFHFVSVLAVVLLFLLMLRLLSQRESAGASRSAAAGKGITLVALAGFFTVAVVGVWRQLPDRLVVYLLVLFTFLALQLVLGGWPHTRGSGRLRLWLLLLLAAAALHLVWVLARVFRVEDASPYPRLLISLGEALAVTVAAASPICLLPAGTRLLVPGAVGTLFAGAGLGLGLLDWPLARQLTASAFGLELPFPPVGIVLYAIGLGAFAATAVALLSRPGPTRLRGYGLLVIGLAGYQLELPFQVASALIGLACVIESAMREHAAGLDVDAWRRLVQRVAAKLGAREVMIAGPPGFEEMRARVPLEGEVDGALIAPPAGSAVSPSAELAMRRAAGRLALVEVAVGHAPSGEAPPLSLHPRGARRLGRREGLEVKTGEPAFDAAYVVFDARRLDHGDTVLTGDMLARLRAHPGWLGVWPGRGARMRTASPPLLGALAEGSPAGEEALGEIVGLVVELSRRGAVAPVD